MLRFCEGKRAVMIVEEGQPNFVEQNLATILRHAGPDHGAARQGHAARRRRIHRCRTAQGCARLLERYGRLQPLPVPAPVRKVIPLTAVAEPAKPLGDSVHARPPGFCTGCPERPIFSAMKLVERELGAHHVSADIGCHLFSILPPFNLGNTTMGYGLGGAGAAALNAPAAASARSR